MTSTNENISPQVLRQVAKELSTLTSSPPEGIKVFLNEEDITDIQATIIGPDGTPYEGGAFRMKLVLSNDFPTTPPQGFFLTKIFHPNVAKSGAICVNTLKKDWKKEMGISHVLTVVKCLLIHPNPASALNEEAGKLLLESFDDFARHARMMTDIHAKPSDVCLLEDASAAKGKPAKKTEKKFKGKDKKRNLKRL